VDELNVSGAIVGTNFAAVFSPRAPSAEIKLTMAGVAGFAEIPVNRIG
jgi:hypothetical protein